MLRLFVILLIIIDCIIMVIDVFFHPFLSNRLMMIMGASLPVLIAVYLSLKKKEKNQV